MFSTKSSSGKMKFLSAAFIFAIVVAALAGGLSAGLAAAGLTDENSVYYKFEICSPLNGAPAKEDLTLKFIVKTNEPPLPPQQPPASLHFGYALDMSYEALGNAHWYPLRGTRESITNQISASGEATYECTATLPALSIGNHNITIYRGPEYSSTSYWKELYSYVFTVVEPPRVYVGTPTNGTDAASGVLLSFRVHALSLSWVGYSVNGEENVTVDVTGLVESKLVPFTIWDGNLTLNGLSSGEHNVVFYAKDGWGNSGVSTAINLQVPENSSQPTSTPQSTDNPTATPTLTSTPTSTITSPPTITPTNSATTPLTSSPSESASEPLTAPPSGNQPDLQWNKYWLSAVIPAVAAAAIGLSLILLRRKK
ncbi:MAG: hypothetical protein NWF05_03285 [Candidatus Bathyarchaeota archaeon]|nr:hypothetical protein [Candidatus Bathyarchaeota archaeon]